MASEAAPRAAAMAASKPGSTVIMDAREPRTPGIPGAEDVVRAVLAVQAELERVAAGNQGAALPLAVALGRLQGVNLREYGVQRGAGVLVVGVERFLAVLDPGHLGFQGGEFALGLPAALLPCLEGLTEPAEFRLRGLHPGARGAHLPGQFGQAFAAVGGGAEQGSLSSTTFTTPTTRPAPQPLPRPLRRHRRHRPCNRSQIWPASASVRAVPFQRSRLVQRRRPWS